MTTNLQVNDQFPDIELPNYQNELKRLSQFTKPSLLDQHLGFLDGYPMILGLFSRVLLPRATSNRCGDSSSFNSPTRRELRQARGGECRPAAGTGGIPGWTGSAVDVLIRRAAGCYQADQHS